MGLDNNDYGKVWGVRESLVNGKFKVCPEIFMKPISFLESFIQSGVFESILISTTSDQIAFFSNKKAAEDYLDELNQPLLM